MNLKLIISIAVLIGTVTFFGTRIASASEEEAGRCNCSHPVSGQYGMLTGQFPFLDCIPVDCWIPWPQ